MNTFLEILGAVGLCVLYLLFVGIVYAMGATLTDSKCYRCPFLGECAQRQIPTCYLKDKEETPKTEAK